ncbi:hypothetical protein IAT38_002544 [Cryptococcus sp. DSM 104549]
MSGFILGTGSGVLAAAAVYYTLSTSLSTNTAHLRSDLHNANNLLNSSFDPTTPPAQSSLIGPSSTAPPPPQFSVLLRQRWNDTLTGFVGGVRKTDWEVVGKEAWEVGRSVVARVSEAGGEAVEQGKLRGAAGSTEKEGGVVGGVVEQVKERVGEVVDKVKGLEKEAGDAKRKLEGIDLHKEQVGTVGGRREELRKSVEQAKGRMV